MKRNREPLNAEGQRVYARLTAHVARELARALAKESKFGTITRAELARRLGRDKGFVTRKLSGGENMELRTVAAFLAALGYEMDVAARRIDAPPGEGRNFFHETSPVASPTITFSPGPGPNTTTAPNATWHDPNAA
ncbi:MAG: helix-turn-helix domain-containing protein [Acidibrevibacterium sp.]|uniref:helix-turn-helix domain-containing protein n=1 Tax=Acidibrevibacterium sp. TaxID=2606776 RepID=UPI003CFD75DE